MAASGEKKHPPSPQKLLKARRQGQVPRSREMGQALSLAAVLGAVALIAPVAARLLLELLRRCLQSPLRGFEQPAAVELFGDVALWILATSGAALVAGVGFGLVNGGFVFKPRFQLGAINPARGLKRIFSAERLVDLGILLARLVTTVAVAALLLHGKVAALLSPAPAGPFLGFVLGLLKGLAVAMVLLSAVFGVFDLWLQRFRHRKRLRMTDDELKREYKEQEGDPVIKQKRRQLHRQLVSGVGMHALSRARVVVTNPTHVAVALAYSPEEDDAPWVVVSGWHQQALAIREAAQRLGIVVVEQVQLARSLVKLEWGEEIPESAYHAVAEIIELVERLELERKVVKG